MAKKKKKSKKAAGSGLKKYASFVRNFPGVKTKERMEKDLEKRLAKVKREKAAAKKKAASAWKRKKKC